MIYILKLLTDWTLCYFTSDVDETRIHFFSNAHYGRSSVMLWKRYQETITIKQLKTRIVLKY